MQVFPRGAARAAALFVILSVSGCCVCPESRAADIVNYNFNKDDGGWFSPDGSWKWSKQASNEGSWKLTPVTSAESIGILYSPCYEVRSKDVTVTFDLRNGHRFDFGFPLMAGTVAAAGQVQYSLDGGLTWSADMAWNSTGNDVPPTLDTTLLTSPGPLLLDGFAFQGASPGFAQGTFIKSAFTIGELTFGGDLRFRFLGDQRIPQALGPGLVWDVEEIQIKGVAEVPCVPEPGGLVLAAAGLAVIVAGNRLAAMLAEGHCLDQTYRVLKNRFTSSLRKPEAQAEWKWLGLSGFPTHSLQLALRASLNGLLNPQ